MADPYNYVGKYFFRINGKLPPSAGLSVKWLLLPYKWCRIPLYGE